MKQLVVVHVRRNYLAGRALSVTQLFATKSVYARPSSQECAHTDNADINVGEDDVQLKYAALR